MYEMSLGIFVKEKFRLVRQTAVKRELERSMYYSTYEKLFETAT